MKGINELYRRAVRATGWMKRFLHKVDLGGIKQWRVLVLEFAAVKYIRTAAAVRLLESVGKKVHEQDEPHIIRWARNWMFSRPIWFSILVPINKGEQYSKYERTIP